MTLFLFAVPTEYPYSTDFDKEQAADGRQIGVQHCHQRFTVILIYPQQVQVLVLMPCKLSDCPGYLYVVIHYQLVELYMYVKLCVEKVENSAVICLIIFMCF
jgi:hypothetical protein